MKYVTVASTFSGNKGAASMLEASIQTLSARDLNATFTVLTVYPEDDKKFNTYNNVTLLPAKPLFLGAILNPLALLYRLLPPLRPLLRKQKHIGAIAAADVVLDEGGITFVDGRAKFLIYNVATILPALCIGTRVVKCSQAMGPFQTTSNRLAAKLILPRVDTICARGSLTHQYLKGLGLNNIIESTDYAFLLEIEKPEAKKAAKVLQQSGLMFDKKSKTVGLMPSEVVRKKTETTDQDYINYNVEFINYLLAEGYRVLLMAYSARDSHSSRHNNDLPVCRDIAAKINHPNFTFLDQELSAQQLRYIIGQLDMVVTSRFHAMVAALAMATPPLVVGWSHKYAEIMDMFGLKESALDSKKLDQKRLRQAFSLLAKNQEATVKTIKLHLPVVQESARKQIDSIVS